MTILGKSTNSQKFEGKKEEGEGKEEEYPSIPINKWRVKWRGGGASLSHFLKQKHIMAQL
jgi:hypothetical protein